MKILHVGEMAGVACCLSKWLKKAGHESHVIANYDPFSFFDYYKDEQLIQGDDEKLADEVGKIAKDYDILHFHSLYKFLPRFRKPMVIQYHGSDLYHSRDSLQRKYCQQFAKKILVVNKYMQQYEPAAEWLPLPVDTELFSPSPYAITNFPFMFDIDYLDVEKARKELENHNINWCVVGRDLPYIELPRFFTNYSGYIDLRYHKEQGFLPAHSKTALEALATGLRVFSYEKKWIHGLPPEHSPKSVTSSLVKIYENCLSASRPV